MQAYDQHMNMVVSDVLETTRQTDTSEEPGSEVARMIDLAFVRGDSVLLVSPLPRGQ